MKKIKLYSVALLLLVLILFPSASKAAPDDAVTVFSLTTVSHAFAMGYDGGFVTNGPDIFESCKDFANILKNQANDYYVSINGKEFKVGYYNVMDTPSYDQNNLKQDGYNINLFVGKNKKNENNYLYIDCAENTNTVVFSFIGEQFGKKWSINPTSETEQSVFISSVNQNLKKIATKGTFVQNGYSGEWGGYTYTTPWKSTFSTLDNKLVLVSEVASHEPKTFMSSYSAGGFANYAKCLKSDKPFCFKKVGNKLVMFTRIGWGSKLVNFWVK